MMTETISKAQQNRADQFAAHEEWVTIGRRSDLIPGSGVGALAGELQIALFWLPELYDTLYAVTNYCPFSGVHLIARGIVGDVGGEPVVASPLYKQHFSLLDGRCLEDPEQKLQVFQARFYRDEIQVLQRRASGKKARAAA
ncbi:MAG: nitrite reductase small subunit NirD [Natronospirillum sp.]|uniref:nitrite reductase small subunit NirD n=1 Tax=Natronospirillum sp. TaxID=2812955 RepID=UPI0025D4F36A|nr:nitrite reductase small subunit NirD [Natronospirillum sp.]MCH8550637.1 nitrite reductase small subunit NirD [Natronospirillum sp.]